MAVSELGYQALSLAEGQAMKQRPGVAVRAGSLCARASVRYLMVASPPARLTQGWGWPQSGCVPRAGVPAPVQGAGDRKAFFSSSETTKGMLETESSGGRSRDKGGAGSAELIG